MVFAEVVRRVLGDTNDLIVLFEKGKGLQIYTRGVRVKVLVKCSQRRVLPNVVQEVDSTDIFSNVKGFATLLKFLEVDASLMICVEIGECIGPPTIGENFVCCC